MPDQVTRSAARVAALAALPVALVAGLVTFWTLGGFHGSAAPAAPVTPTPQATAPLPLPARSLSSRDATMCLALVAHLPPSVRGLPERAVVGGPEQNAAYGQPPLVLGCGSAAAPSVAPDAMVWNLSGVCWYADQSRPDSTVWTTLDRQVPVSITVPNSYQGQGAWVQEFTTPILQWVPALSRLPAGCPAVSTAPS